MKKSIIAFALLNFNASLLVNIFSLRSEFKLRELTLRGMSACCNGDIQKGHGNREVNVPQCLFRLCHGKFIASRINICG